MKTVTIYTDGSCKSNPGPGGFAAILTSGEHTRDISGGERHTTNNRMELRAILAGLEATLALASERSAEASVTRPAAITVYSDSLYAIGAFTGNKIRANQDIILGGLMKIEALKKLGCTVTFAHVNGHAGDPLNERADKLASYAAIAQKGT